MICCDASKCRVYACRGQQCRVRLLLPVSIELIAFGLQFTCIFLVDISIWIILVVPVMQVQAWYGLNVYPLESERFSFGSDFQHVGAT
jgi:hypothetical protein